MTTPTPDTAPTPLTPDVEEDLMRWLFGDGEDDPGSLIEAGVKNPALVTWLEGFERDYPRLKVAVTPAASEALSRAAALRSEIAHRQAHPVVFPAADNVRSLDAARRARGSRLKNGLVIGGILATIAAASLLLVRIMATSPPEVDAMMAKTLVGDLAGGEGFGFAGDTEPSPRDRGFLLGAVLDLSRPRKATGQVASAELELARELADRALLGLDAPEDPEARRQRVLGGCGAILATPEDRQACEAGYADYLKRRDAY